MTPGERGALDREARRREVTASELVRELIRAADCGRKATKGDKSPRESE
jgi:hypothetical protein